MPTEKPILILIDKLMRQFIDTNDLLNLSDSDKIRNKTLGNNTNPIAKPNESNVNIKTLRKEKKTRYAIVPIKLRETDYIFSKTFICTIIELDSTLVDNQNTIFNKNRTEILLRIYNLSVENRHITIYIFITIFTHFKKLFSEPSAESCFSRTWSANKQSHTRRNFPDKHIV